MRPPKTVKIGAHEYRVTRLPAKLQRSKHGDCSDDELEIRLGRNRNPSKTQEILLHEIAHAMFYAVPIKWGEVEEEDIVEMLAPKLLQVLKDNPKLIAFLTT